MELSVCERIACLQYPHKTNSIFSDEECCSQRLASTFNPGTCINRSSAVTSVRSYTFAVATKNRSAGSRYPRMVNRNSCGTSQFNGISISLNSCFEVLKDSPKSFPKRIRFFSKSTIASQMLMAERNRSFLGSVIWCVTSEESLCASEYDHIQICVSKSSLISTYWISPLYLNSRQFRDLERPPNPRCRN